MYSSYYHLQRQEKKPTWTENILTDVNRALRSHENTNKLFFKYEISPHSVLEYKELQEEIAKKIPIEANRPTIWLTIRGKNRSSKSMINTPDIGFIGGTGPLSDAHFMDKLISERKENKEDMYVTLLSAPPPRSPADIFKRGTTYFSYIHLFTSTKCDYYALLSNTAHKRIGVVPQIATESIKMLNLIENISKNLADSKIANRESILILGTLEAQQADLYPMYLEKAGISKKTTYFPEEKEQRTLQAYIDQMKSSQDDDKKREEYFNFINNQIIKTKATTVILACTELPFFLYKQKSSQEGTYLDCLQKQHPTITFIDTEKEMLRHIKETESQLESNKIQIINSQRKVYSLIQKVTRYQLINILKDISKIPLEKEAKDIVKLKDFIETLQKEPLKSAYLTYEQITDFFQRYPTLQNEKLEFQKNLGLLIEQSTFKDNFVSALSSEVNPEVMVRTYIKNTLDNYQVHLLNKIATFCQNNNIPFANAAGTTTTYQKVQGFLEHYGSHKIAITLKKYIATQKLINSICTESIDHFNKLFHEKLTILNLQSRRIAPFFITRASSVINTISGALKDLTQYQKTAYKRSLQ